MDLDALFILLQPWLRPFLVVCFFYIFTLFLQSRITACTASFNSKTSFEYGEDLLNAFEKPVHFSYLFLLFMQRLIARL